MVQHSKKLGITSLPIHMLLELPCTDGCLVTRVQLTKHCFRLHNRVYSSREMLFRVFVFPPIILAFLMENFYVILDNDRNTTEPLYFEVNIVILASKMNLQLFKLKVQSKPRLKQTSIWEVHGDHSHNPIHGCHHYHHHVRGNSFMTQG